MSILQEQIGGNNCVQIQIGSQIKQGKPSKTQSILNKIKTVFRLGKKADSIFIDSEQEAGNE